jgi:hypothetical protein
MLRKIGMPTLLALIVLLLTPQAASARTRLRFYSGVTPVYTSTVPMYDAYGYRRMGANPYPDYYVGPASPYYYMYPRHEWSSLYRRHHR